jgi:diguanylate cyclase (GGDEF)-like protein
MYGEAHSETRKDAGLDENLRFRAWPLDLKQMWEEFFSARINRELRFISAVGLATCIACLFFDAQAGVLELGILLRLGLVAPAYVIGIALLRHARGLARTLATVTPIAIFASVASCLGLAAEGAFTERYLIATAVLIAFSVMFLPLRAGATLFLAIAGIAAIVIPVFVIEGVRPETIGLYVFVLICCSGPIAIKLRSHRVKDSNFLLTLKSRQAQEDLLALNGQLETLSNIDPLTAVLNRRGFEQAFEAAYEAARQSDDMMAVLLLDIDHFKRFNDTHGHQAGDQCLVEVERLLGGEFALHEGIAGRYGGEEFIAALFGKASREAETIANRVRTQIAQLDVADGMNGEESISISIGVCIGSPKTVSRETFVTAADRALYAAKHAGRNRVVMLTDETTESSGGDAFGAPVNPGYAVGIV